MLQLTAAAMAETRMPYRILDPHVHVWKHQAEFPFAAGAPVPDWDATPEMLLDLMKEHGVAKTVLIQVSYYRNDNRYMASVLKQYPQSFHGVCRVDPLESCGARSAFPPHGRGWVPRPAPEPDGRCDR